MIADVLPDANFDHGRRAPALLQNIEGDVSIAVSAERGAGDHRALAEMISAASHVSFPRLSTDIQVPSVYGTLPDAHTKGIRLIVDALSVICLHWNGRCRKQRDQHQHPCHSQNGQVDWHR